MCNRIGLYFIGRKILSGVNSFYWSEVQRISIRNFTNTIK